MYCSIAGAGTCADAYPQAAELPAGSDELQAGYSQGGEHALLASWRACEVATSALAGVTARMMELGSEM